MITTVKKPLNKFTHKYFIILLLASLNVNAQLSDYVKEVDAIALFDQYSHSGIMTALSYNGTSASNNFDIKYFRCEWKVNPAIRYITGIVTIYYTITSTTSGIALDLMNTLNTDSVKQRKI